MKDSKLFGRIGKRDDVVRASREVKKAGGVVTENRDAQTTVATNPLDGATIFKALHKGNGIWLIMYSTDYYPKT